MQLLSDTLGFSRSSFPLILRLPRGRLVLRPRLARGASRLRPHLSSLRLHALCSTPPEKTAALKGPRPLAPVALHVPFRPQLMQLQVFLQN